MTDFNFMSPLGLLTLLLLGCFIAVKAALPILIISILLAGFLLVSKEGFSALRKMKLTFYLILILPILTALLKAFVSEVYFSKELWVGFLLGLKMSLRFTLLLICFRFLTRSFSVNQTIQNLTRLGSPHFAFTLGIALNLLGDLSRVSQEIFTNAWQRGAFLRNCTKNFKQVIISILSYTASIAQDMAETARFRGFNPHSKIVKQKPKETFRLKLAKGDLIVLIVLILLFLIWR